MVPVRRIFFCNSKHAVQERFRGRRAAGNVNVDRHDAIAASHYRIGIMIIAAAIRARAHRDHVARLRHLVVNLAQRRRHFVGERAGDDHDVRLARRRTRCGSRNVPRHNAASTSASFRPRSRQDRRSSTSSEPVRAQLMRSSVAVTRKPLSPSSSLSPEKNGSRAATTLPVRGSMILFAAGSDQSHSSAPFLHSYMKPMVSTRQKHHHRPEAKSAEFPERNRPGKQECDFEIENDEQERDEIEAHVEFHARIVEGVETAFVGRKLLGVGPSKRRPKTAKSAARAR